MEKEYWKDVVGYEGLYKVSNLGNVKSLDRLVNHSSGGNMTIKGRVLKKALSNKYLVVSLNRYGKCKTIAIHRLVAHSFLNHEPNSDNIVVDHIDNNSLNNKIENLQLIKQRENRTKDIDKNKTTSKYIGVSWHKGANKWKSAIRINGKVIHLGYFKKEYDAFLAYKNKLSNLNK